MPHRRELIVMRHAKAGQLPGGPDVERALTPRGQRDSAAAGRWLAASGYLPDAVICSPSRRTRQTWQFLSETLGAQPPIRVEPRLYQADSQQVAEIISATSADVARLLYIGHNPAAAGLVALLTGSEPAFATAAIAVIALPGSWSEPPAGDAALVYTWSPKAGAFPG